MDSRIQADLHPTTITRELTKKRYKIVVTMYGNELTVGGREWKAGADTTEDEPQAGYTPAIEVIREVERKVFEQQVDELDLVEVIKAVNGIVDIDMVS